MTLTRKLKHTQIKEGKQKIELSRCVRELAAKAVAHTGCREDGEAGEGVGMYKRV